MKLPRLFSLQENLRQHPFLGLAFIAIVLAGLYWLFIASDRYVSEARVLMQRSDLAAAPTMDVSGLLTGVNNAQRSDQLLLRDYLMSMDMLRQLDAELQLRGHYSSRGDWLSRLWGTDTPMESFRDYFLRRVAVELDEYAGVLVIRAQAYDARTAHDIAATMVRLGEQRMNALGHELALEQVKFLEQSAVELGERAKNARYAVLDYQNRKGLSAPQAMAESLVAIVGELEARLSELQTRRSGLLGYLQADAPQIMELDHQIKATQEQIAKERARLAAPGGGTLNATVQEYMNLQIDAEFAQETYRNALLSLDRGRAEATRTLKKVAVLQSASTPEISQEPRRFYNWLVFTLVALLLSGVLHLIFAIVRDHRD
jgi:capsular polysaccharide transport system permease protein